MLARRTLFALIRARLGTGAQTSSGRCAVADGVRSSWCAGKPGRRDLAMHLGSNIQPPESIRAAEALLGGRHPLVLALERRVVATRQMLAAVMVLALSVLVMVTGAAAALPVALAGGCVAVVMGWRLALRASEFRQRVWELIISGRGDSSLASVERERSRLLDPTVRSELARAYESLGAEPDVSGRVPARACVIVVPSVMARVQPELTLVSALLRDDEASVRGVAAAQKLLCDGTSSLFGRDDVVLSQDLHRVAYLLCDAGR